MRKHIFGQFVVVLGLVLGLFLVSALSLFSQTSNNYTPHQQIGLRVFRLGPEGEKLGTQCSAGDRSYGCTIYCTNDSDKCNENKSNGYPFRSAEITISIESFLQNGTQQGYLHNVIPSEMKPELYPLVALKAQAITARTYAYWQLDFYKRFGVNPIDNSASGFQVYVPYAYESLTAENRTLIAASLTDPAYISYIRPYTADITTVGRRFLFTRTEISPIFAEFNSESVNYTLDHSTGQYPYMKGVPDPVSSHPELNATYHKHGFIQRGASRWANGNLAADKNDDKGEWVRWEEPFQILTHYYNGIQIRSVTNTTIKTPSYRWVPLDIRWGTSNGKPPPRMSPGEKIPVTVWIQNTGVFSWTANNDVQFVWDTSFGLQSSGQDDNVSSSDSIQGVTNTCSVQVVLASRLTVTFSNMIKICKNCPCQIKNIALY